MIKEERTKFNSKINQFNSNRNNFVDTNKETIRLKRDFLKNGRN